MPSKQSAARPEDASPTLFAFTFEGAPPAEYQVTRVAWAPAAHDLLAGLSNSLYFDGDQKRSLPVRDLRLRTQVCDPGILRVGYRLGIRVARNGVPDYDILYTSTAPDEAAVAANRAVADWVEEAVKKVKGINFMQREMAKKLRTLALSKEGVVEAKTDRVQVFQWQTNPRNNTALLHKVTDFADLADYVASLLIGQEVFPNAGPIRREIGGDLHQGSTRLLTDPVEIPMGTALPCRVSLGLTVRVATYTGRPQPVVIISVEKRVWTVAPTARYNGNNLSGFVFPDGEHRAFKFSVDNRKLAVDGDYYAIASGYPNLPAGEELKADELARDGWQYRDSRVLVSAAPGRSKVDVVGRGLTALDWQVTYEQILDLLVAAGFTPWGGQLRRIKTKAKQIGGLIGEWAVEKHPDPNAEVLKPKEQALAAWTRQLHERLRPHYGGAHQLLIAYQDGLDKDAARVEQALTRILGSDGITITQAMLPADVHGPQWGPDGEKPLAVQARAEAKQHSWQNWIQQQRAVMAAAKQPLPQGIIVLARRSYATGKDDPISKQVGRVALMKGFEGATVQYLLPSAKDATKPTSKQEAKLRMRAVNGWRDVALKSVGRMLDLVEPLANMAFVQAGNQPPILLGAGIIRVNKTRQRRNKTSFIPYLTELDPLTGECQAALLLRANGSRLPPLTTPMQPLKDALLTLAKHGTSYLAENSRNDLVDKERGQLTERFLHDLLLERSAVHQDRELVVMADSSTLSGAWKWLADSRLDPSNVQLHQDNLQQVLPNVTFVRLRRDHAPRAMLPTKQVRTSFRQPDGSYSTPRPSAWGADAKLYRFADPSVGLPTYLSYGSKLYPKLPRGLSSYLATASGKGDELTTGSPYTKTWAMPKALEITVLQDTERPAAFEPNELAELVETLRWKYDHFGGWTTLPGPLHFASVLKKYVPDYDLAEIEFEDQDDEEDTTA